MSNPRKDQQTVTINGVSYPKLDNYMEMNYESLHAESQRLAQGENRETFASNMKVLSNYANQGFTTDKSGDYAKAALYAAQSFITICLAGGSMGAHKQEPIDSMRMLLKALSPKLQADGATKAEAVSWGLGVITMPVLGNLEALDPKDQESVKKNL